MRNSPQEEPMVWAAKFFPATRVIQAWTVLAPVALVVLGSLPEASSDPTSWWVALGLTLVAATAVAIAATLLRLAQITRLPQLVVVIIGPVSYAGLGWLFWWGRAAVARGAGVDTPELTGAELAGQLTSWVAISLVAWMIQGQFAHAALRRSRLVGLGAQMRAMEQLDLVRIDAGLRGLLSGMARHVNRVVQQMADDSPIEDINRIRSVPDPDNDFVSPLAAALAKTWRKATPDDALRRYRLSRTVHYARPPQSGVVAGLIVAVWAGSGAMTTWPSALGIGLAAGLMAATAWILTRVVSRVLTPSIQRGLISLLTVGLVTVLGSWLPSVLFGQQLQPGWLIPALLSVGMLTAWAMEAEVASRDAWARERERELVRLSLRCDDLAGRLAVLRHVEPRMLYSATLGTLIRATVDLTSSEPGDDRRNAAIEEMATRISLELDTLRQSLLPLPDDLILSIVGFWRAITGSEVDIDQKVFSRISWSQEGIAEWSALLGWVMVWTISQSDEPATLRVRSDGVAIEMDAVLPGTRLIDLQSSPEELQELRAQRISIERGPEGAMLTLRWRPPASATPVAEFVPDAIRLERSSAERPAESAYETAGK